MPGHQQCAIGRSCGGTEAEVIEITPAQRILWWRIPADGSGFDVDLPRQIVVAEALDLRSMEIRVGDLHSWSQRDFQFTDMA